MLTLTNKNDILLGDEREGDFLLPKTRAQSKVEKHIRFSLIPEMRPFLLEVVMPKGVFIRSVELLAKLKLHGFQKGQKFSKSLRKKISIGHLGSKNRHWTGGKAKHGDGYIFVLNHSHPFCNKRGYILEHRLIMEQHLGRYLTSKEVVHHENKITNDNRIENLKLFKNAPAHKQYHLLKDGHWHQGLKGRRKVI